MLTPLLGCMPIAAATARPAAARCMTLPAAAMKAKLSTRFNSSKLRQLVCVLWCWNRHITADIVAADMDDARKMQRRVMGCNNPPELVERFKCGPDCMLPCRSCAFVGLGYCLQGSASHLHDPWWCPTRATLSHTIMSGRSLVI